MSYEYISIRRHMMHHYISDAKALRNASNRHKRIGWIQSSACLRHDAHFALRLARVHRDQWLNTPSIMFAEPPKEEAKIIDLV